MCKMFLLRLLVSVTCVSQVFLSDYPLHAYSPGDIVIGGLFPIHLESGRCNPTEMTCCAQYSVQMFLRSQVMVHAIQEINQRTPRVLPDLTLGYDIYDTCGDVSYAIRAALELLEKEPDTQTCLLPSKIYSAIPEPRAKVVIGERYSEISIAVARIFTLSSVPQISYASTSELLSKKFKFPTFLRTVSSDKFQTKGISTMVKSFNWKTVAIIGSDDEYGKYGSDSLDETLSEMQVCIEFVEILSGDFTRTKNKLRELESKLEKSVAEAIILFTKDTNVEVIMELAIKRNLNRTWIASDTWSTSDRIYTMQNIQRAGQVFGFISKRNKVPGFKAYVTSMFHNRTNAIIQNHMTRYPLCSDQYEEETARNCSKQCLDPLCLVSFIDQDESYSIYLAVQVVAEGLRQLLKCDSQRCERNTNFTTSELLEELKKVNFTVNRTRLYFNDGDPSLGYDIVYWNTSNKDAKIQTIGEYWPHGAIQLPEALLQRMNKVDVTRFNCSKTCNPGEMLKQSGTKCCTQCFRCAAKEFSPGNGTVCKKCGDNQHSPDVVRDKCLNNTDDFLQWWDPFSIILSCWAVCAIIVTLVFIVVFIHFRATPIVKAVGGYLCFLELVSLLSGFCLVFTFLGKPQTNSSCVGLPLFGISFCVCISCILANLLQIWVGFKFNLEARSWVKRLNQPLAIVLVSSGIQLALSVSWLTVKPPALTKNPEERTTLHQCDIMSEGFFFSVIAYDAFVAILCFLFAIKSKKLPDLYKNAELVTVAMVLFLIIWIIFLPLYITLRGKYTPAIQCAAILVSCSSILGCHLAPKCYIMIFRKELNNEKAITEYIRKHYAQKGIAVVRS